MKTRHYLPTIVIAAFLLTSGAARAAAPENAAVKPPKTIEYDQKLLSYNPSWKNEETYLKMNLDADPADEVLISFVAFYKTESEKPDTEPAPFQIRQRELLPVYNYVFYQIYDAGPDHKYRLTRTFTGMDRPGIVKVVAMEDGQPPAIIFISPGGASYKDISIYQWQEGGYRLLLNQGTNDEVSIASTPGPLTVSAGRKIFVWDAAQGRFQKQKDHGNPTGMPVVPQMTHDS